MKILIKLGVGFVKYIIVSSLFSVMSLVIMAGLFSHHFPPTLADLKGLKKSFDSIAALRNSVGDPKHLSELQSGLQKTPTIDTKKIMGDLKDSAQTYSDPALDDVNEIMQYRQRQAQLSQMIGKTQEQIPANLGNDRGVASAQEGTKETAPSESTERIRKLEDLVSHLHEQVQNLKQELSALKQQVRGH